MLRHLSIRDVVLIDALDLSFGAGLSVLTGETGAGKSILLDAFGLALGARADSGLVRAGSERAVVAATLDPPDDPALLDLLSAQGIAVEPGEDMVLRRVVGSDGRSRAFVNDQPVSVGLLREIGDRLVEIHGQFERMSITEAANQRRTLDAFAGLDGQAETVADRYRAWRAARDAMAEAERGAAAARAEEERLRADLDELDALAPVAGEDAELAARRQFMQNAERLIAAVNEAATLLSGEEGTADHALQAAARVLERHGEQAGGRLDPVVAAIDRAGNELAEAMSALNAFAHEIDADPAALEAAEERLFALRAAARRHAVEPDALPGVHETLRARLALLDGEQDRMGTLAKEAETARRAYREAAEALSKARQEAAKVLAGKVNAELPPLRLERASLTVTVERMAEEDWGEAGMDAVAYLVATNPGSAPGPIGKIASGGELSRFMLALKVVIADAAGAPTLVFDEVDSGIGGATAAAVGERLSRLAGGESARQVLVVTHSPQVAAAGSAHWRVEKRAVTRDGAESAATDIQALDDDARREEIARMLAGSEITEEARAAAGRLMRRDSEGPARAAG